MDSAPPAAYAPLTVSKIAGTICAYCHLVPPHTGSTKLSRCAICKRASYCGAKCQKADWKLMHKMLCKKFVEMNEFERTLDGRGKLSRIDNALLNNQRFQMFTGSDDKTLYYDKRYVQDQPRCDVCFRNPFMSQDFYTLKTCAACPLAWHCPTDECTKEFKTVHRKSECDALATHAAVERMKIDYALLRRSQRSLMIRTEHPARRYIPLSSMKTWDEYCRRHFVEFDFSVSQLAKEPSLTRMNSMAHAKKALGMMARETASLPLTIVSGMEKAIPDLATRKRLRVYIVGSSEREAMGKGLMEEILHLLPACRNLTIGFIGPEAIVSLVDQPNLACSYCQAVGTRRQCVYYRGQYHDFVKTREGSVPADFIVGFNTGMSEVDGESWAQTIGVILDSKIPAAFTAYSQPEIGLEKALFDRLDAKFVLEPEQNNWKGVIPILNTWPIAETNEESWSYVNYYWYIIEGRK